MPHKTFHLDEVAEYLHLSVADVERLVRDDAIPHEYQGSRLVFRQRNIDSWANQRIMGMDHDKLEAFHKVTSAKAHDLSFSHALMPELMKPAYIEPALQARTRPSVIRDMIALANTTDLVIYPDDFKDSVMEREKMCSTAMPGGFALMHTHYHDPYMFEDSFVVLGRCVQPLPFHSPDGFRTDMFFLLCCQDDRIHLHMMARLCMLCQRTSLILELRDCAGVQEMYDLVLAREDELIRSRKV